MTTFTFEIDPDVVDARASAVVQAAIGSTIQAHADVLDSLSEFVVYEDGQFDSEADLNVQGTISSDLTVSDLFQRVPVTIPVVSNTISCNFDTQQFALVDLASSTASTVVADFTLPSRAGTSGVLIVTNHPTTPRFLQWFTFPPTIVIWRPGAFANSSGDAAGSVRIYQWYYDGSRLFMEQSAAYIPL